jgi:CRP-like cAMP-binding protein
MIDKNERRRFPRKAGNHELIGMVYSEAADREPAAGGAWSASPIFLEIHDYSACGALVESPRDFERESCLEFLWHDLSTKAWRSDKVRVVHSRSAALGEQAASSQPLNMPHTQSASTREYFLLGLQFLAEGEAQEGAAGTGDACLRAPSADLEFLIHTDLLDSVPRSAICHLLNCLRPKTLKAGERLFSQGDTADDLYLVQTGSCSVKVEQDGELHPVARLREGDVVGEIAVLTGEARSAHVDADCDMKLWSLSKKQFEEVSDAHPDLRYFLTELLTNRFESETVTSERTIGRYVIKGRVGKGGWSIVYRGAHKALNLPVAIKMLKHVMAMEPDFLDKFRNEAQIIARMNHKNIVQVFDIEELYRTMFIIMEYLQGEPLDDLLERSGRIPIPRAVNLLIQICHGLGYAHEKGIIHQDIKPANIFVQPQDQIKILDFGLACKPGSEDLNLAGTIYYAAPEQIQCDPVDVRTDIYSLGLTAYEMVTGVRPYPEDDLNALADAHVNEDIPNPSDVVVDLPDALAGFILKACRRDPKDRYQTISAALDDLQPLHDDLCRGNGKEVRERRKMMNLVFLYHEEQQLALSHLLDEFSSKVQEMGVDIKAASFENI